MRRGLLGLALALGGCATSAADVLDGSWVLTHMSGQSELISADDQRVGADRATLTVAPDARIFGRAFCGHYSSNYRLHEGRLLTRAAALGREPEATEVLSIRTGGACISPMTGNLEREFLDILFSSPEFRKGRGTFELKSADGRSLVFRRTSSAGPARN